ncbi:MAG: long-chain fatty acid--CoA ligase [Alphaproteobacteria bacterium]|nr:long-chain fatty acid--CoA ligase [Alphaproteobacteria bacterium]
MFDFARRRAELSPDRLAFIEAKSGREVTYCTLDDRAARAARILRDLGIGRGDRIAFLMLNEIAFFELLFAAARIGAIAVPLNWRLAAGELQTILSDCSPRLLVHDAAHGEMAAQLDLPTLSLAEYEKRIGAAAPARSDDAWQADGTWYLLYTSGTTGRPKAVIQTFGMSLANYVNLSQAIGLTAADRTLNFLPLFHTAGINLHTLPTLIAGGTVTIFPKFDADQVMGAIDEGEATCFFGVPSVYQALALHPRFTATRLDRVRHWGSGGAPLPEPLLRKFLNRGARICAGYGMTETGPTLCLMDPESVEIRIGSSGRPQILSRIRIVDVEGKDVATGASGEVLVKGSNVTPGYWNNAEATRAAFTADGWLRTGDVGRLDAEGYVTILDRIKDMFISGGENVYPAEVEHALLAHPEVLEAAVIGVADERWGEVGRAFVVPRADARPEPERLRAFCRERIAGYKVPKTILVVADLPRTAAGKVQKHVLRQQAS